MKHVYQTLIVAIALVALTFVSQARASSTGWIHTERFGYEGTITRYADSDLT